MPPRTRHILLYILNAGLLLTHEIYSAYWREWDLFGLRGGIEGFLVVNFFLTLIVLYGLFRLVDNSTTGYRFSLILAAAGVCACIIHTLFLLAGHREFSTPASELLLGCILIVSLVQGIAVQRHTREERTS